MPFRSIRLPTDARWFVLLVLLAVSTAGGQETSPAIHALSAPARINDGPTLPHPDLRQTIAEAAASIEEEVRRALAHKPSPYLVKPHDVGRPTGFHSDIPWHLLDKEKDDRLDLRHRGDLGIANLSADVTWRIGIGVDDQPVEFSPARQYVHHLINLAVQRIESDEMDVLIAFLPVTSDTALVILEVTNASDRAHTLSVHSVCTKPRVDDRPIDRHGHGVHVTSGRRQWVRYNEPNHALVTAFQDWDRRHNKPAGTLLCTLGGDRKPDGTAVSSVSQDKTEYTSSLEYRVPLAPKATTAVMLAMNLHRFGPQRVETRRQVVLWPQEDKEEAVAYGVTSMSNALRVDWPELMAASFDWYTRLPRLELPNPRWVVDFYCALELPRANTWSAQEKMASPWYSFCRAHGHDAFGWWSYGMHGHEHLSTFVVNITQPGLSADFLRGHFRSQRENGYIPYGVNHRGVNIHRSLATCPLLMLEAWTAYTWSGDREFLKEAYENGSRYLHWWRSPDRTRRGAELQHWKDYVETVRDDADLPTWTATDGAENQEALDLNCYLLNEERALAAMARELGRDGDAVEWAGRVDRRADLIRQHLLHPEDEIFYGRDTLNGRWARVLDISTFFPLLSGIATGAESQRIVDLLDDPQAFGTDYPIATLAVEHMADHLRGEYHWRGANWVEMTWLAMMGLKQYGYHDEAAELAEINCRMVFDTLERTSHFREYYNSLTGAPAGLTDYIWTSMPAIMVIDVFFGIRPTAEGLEILPALPEGWPSIELSNLRIRHTTISLTIRRDPETTTTHATLNGRPLPTYARRGVFVKWRDLPRTCDIHITQPMKIESSTHPRSLFAR